MIDPWWVLAALTIGAAVTYAWRAVGVALAGRIAPDGRVIDWVGYVAYALLAGLIARMIVMPIGALAGAPLPVRLVAAAIALGVYFACGRRLLPAVLAGGTALSGLAALMGLLNSTG